MNLSLVLADDGTPDLTPDDFFEQHGVPLRLWLDRVGNDDRFSAPTTYAALVACRAQAFAAAFGLYREAAASIYGERGDPLRHEPWVLTEYDSLTGSVAYLFIFKADNNGNTYRVRYVPEES